MNTINQILMPESIVCNYPAKSKKNILDKISKIAAEKITNSSEKDLLISLMSREKLSSTGIGKGIAIPHGRLDNTNQVVAVLITTETAIEFDAIDDKPVDIFFAILFPQSNASNI